MSRKFRIGLARTFLTANSGYDLGLGLLDGETRVACELLEESLPEIAPKLIAGFDAAILGGERFTRASLSGDRMQLSIVARMGVGFATFYSKKKREGVKMF